MAALPWPFSLLWPRTLSPDARQTQPGVPARFRQHLTARYTGDRVLGITVVANDTTLPMDRRMSGVMYRVHELHFNWDGISYRIEIKDGDPKVPLEEGAVFPILINPDRPTEVWMLGDLRRCNPIVPPSDIPLPAPGTS